MKKQLCILLAAMLLLLFASACASAPQEPQEGLEAALGALISTPEDMIRFLSGTEELATVTNDISLGDAMLRLEGGRGHVTINGEGHVISGNNACVLRMENGSAATLNDISIIGTLGGIGVMGDAALYGTGCGIRSDANGIEATGKVTIGESSGISVESKNGSAILCAGAEIQASAVVSATGRKAAINTGRGDLTIMEGAQVTCAGGDYNAVKTDGDLILGAGSVLSAVNTDTHNGAKVGALIADETATIQATGGQYGIGLFIVEQVDDVTLKGYCKPDVRYEMGAGRVHFKN